MNAITAKMERKGVGRMNREQAERVFALAARAEFMGPEAPRWIELLEPERERLVETARFFARRGEEVRAAELAANVWRLWLLTGDVPGGRRLLSAALDVAERAPSRARALALYGDGLLAFRMGAQAESRERNEAALEAARAVDDREAEALALVGLSRVAFRDGDYARVRTLAAEARELTRHLDAATHAAPLHMLAAGTRLAGNYDDAAALYTESLEVNRRLGDTRMVAIELHNLGHVDLHRCSLDAAERRFAERARLHNPDDPYEAAMTHLNQAALALARGNSDRAAELLHRTQSTLNDAGIVLDPDDAFEVAWLRDRLDGSPADEAGA
jgi:tetratricopeptide (TPR) repeat protein